MALKLTEEQALLRDSAREMIARHSPVNALRKLRDDSHPVGYDPAFWQQMVEAGWSGIIVPERYGGLDFGFVGLGVVMEECGRALVASPLLATGVAGCSALLLGGNDAQRERHLTALVSGAETAALALEEGRHHQPTDVAMSARPDGDGWRLSGAKTFVLDGHSADWLLVVARSAGDPGDTHGLSLFWVRAEQEGIRRERHIMVDSRNAASIDFDEARIDADGLVGEAGEGWNVLAPLLDRMRIALAAEMLGGASEAFDRTMAYLKEREQFGVKIGAFQALQHRAADMFTELELSRSAVLGALSALDEGADADELARLASVAKMRMNDTFSQVADEAVQMHGGIGATDELDIGLFLKRCRVAMHSFGDSAWHIDRYASLQGF